MASGRNAMANKVTRFERDGWSIRVLLRWSTTAECFGGYAEVFNGDQYQFRVVLTKHFSDHAAAERSLIEKADFWIKQWRAMWL